MSVFARRLSMYSRRALRTAGGRGLTARIFFLHMPKCGGTALAEGMYGTVALHRRIGVIDAPATRIAAARLHHGSGDPLLCHEDLPFGHETFALREGIALTHLSWTTQMVHGHVLATTCLLSALGQDWALVTMLRDPYARAISNYRMAVRAGVIPDDIDAWLEGAVGQSMAQVYLRYFSGANVIAPGAQAEALSRAEAHMDRFALIGFLDDPRSFQTGFAARFGVRPHFPRRNEARGPELSLTPVQEARLRDLLGPDQRLYDLARMRFAARPAAQPSITVSADRAAQSAMDAPPVRG